MTIKRPKRFIYGVFGAALLNTLLCFLIAFFYLKKPIKNDADMTLLQRGSWFTTFILGIDKKPPKEQFLFIDISRDKQLVDILDENGFPSGNMAITDREKLAELFNVLGSKPKNQPLILCDVLFDSKSPSDSALELSMAKLPNLVLSYTFSEDDKSLVVPVFKNVKRGIANYETHNNTFMKFRLAYKDTLPTVPLQMYEITHQKKFEHGTLFNYLGGKRILSHFAPPLKIRNYDLFEAPEKQRYSWIRLGELLMFPEDILKICKGRILVIGNFAGNADKHETVMGDLYGPLILVNTYIALKNGDNIITVGWLAMLFFSFFFISFFTFWQVDVKQMRVINWLNYWLSRGLFKHIIRLMTYVFGLTLVSVASYLFFNIHLNIMIMGGFFYLLDSAVKFAYRRKGWLEKVKKEEA
ncbi:hypothetical protein BKI52_21430 [marine bacterium AO1-C]|nr:hypothetical protein BKI52_21430 [marine bacterium AO1-C]